jgi:hypothetical protein
VKLRDGGEGVELRGQRRRCGTKRAEESTWN